MPRSSDRSGIQEHDPGARADDFGIPLTDRAFWRALAMLETVGG
jgi:hypothetical protein